MTEVEQVKKRIDDSGFDGVLNDQIRDDYKPAGDMILMTLTDSGEYVQRRAPANSIKSRWRIFNKKYKPY